MTKFLNISTDDTLGGSSASDEVVSSQKAIASAISVKADDSTVVHKTGTETITGFKTLSAGAKITTTQSGAILELESAASGTNFLLKRTNGATCVVESGNFIGLLGTYSNHPFQIRTNYVNRMEFGTNGSVTLATAPSENSNDNQVATTAWTNSKIPTVNNATLTITQGGTTKGTFTANASSDVTIALDAGGGGGFPSQTGNAGKFLTTDGTDASWGRVKTNNLFDRKWCDYELNDQNWLRADTFSWQDGTVYSEAYSHLVADIDGISSSTETIAGTTITYYQATDGHKIVLANQETNVQSIYTATGVAWYYILDTDNVKFKLPRINTSTQGIDLEADVLISSTEHKNTNLLQNTMTFANSTDNGTSYNAFSGTTGIFINNGALCGNSYASTTNTVQYVPDNLYVDLANKTSIYSGKKYLYFYVGQFSQSATEQTAGLNAELFNGKVDLDAANLSDAGKSLIAGLGMPSDTYDDLTILASGQTYTAPADGYFCFQVPFTGNQACTLINNTQLLGSQATANGTWTSYAFVPALKGDIIALWYNCTPSVFRFVYALGNKSEAS